MKQRNKIVITLSTTEIKKYVLPETYEQGMGLFKKGRITSFHINDNVATARVKEVFNHHVKIIQTKEKLIFNCCCYEGRNNAPCHHSIAACLYLLKKNKKKYNPTKPKLKKSIVSNNGYLDPEKWEKLFKNTVKSSLKISDNEASGYAENLEYLIDTLIGLPQQKQANNILILTEYALSEIDDNLDYIEDSDDHIGVLLDKIQKLHLTVCKISQPNPLKIAEILFKWQREDKCDVANRNLTSYIDVMGDKGLSKYRALAEADWSKTNPIGPRDFDTEDWFYENGSNKCEKLDIDNQWAKWGNLYSITSIMTELEKLDGDLNSLVDVMAHDLSTPYNFIKIAQLYQENGLLDKALEWAEKGMNSFGENYDYPPDLVTYIVKIYSELGQHDQAMHLAWTSFKEWPTMGTYRILESHAIAANQRQKWRDKAISHTRKQYERESISADEGYSLLVDIALYEGDIDTAWNEAQQGGCYNFIWLSLAQSLGEKHPVDAIQICQEQVNILINEKKANKVECELIIKFLECMKPISNATDGGQIFKELVIKIQTQKNQIESLLKNIESKGWLQ